MTRIAVLDKSKCHSDKCQLECITVCPGPKVGINMIYMPENEVYPVIEESLCTGCGLCPKRCPFNAIKIINLAEELGTPTFQYGINTFRLYGFPFPRTNAVVGLVGVNGIGKTTALELLQGRISPNLGKPNATAQEVREFFRGKEVLNYLDALAKHETRMAYKMQDVGELAVNAKVIDLMKKCDERNALEKIAEEFRISHLLDRKLNELSGGELQLVAIACTFLRNAQTYFFDEPSSYLDVKQRFFIAEKIRELAQTHAVVVVEHDLAVLDYLCDFVHVLFGDKGAYGRISGLKGARNGINEFLQGYLIEENVRFRKDSISFVPRSGERGQLRETMKYPAMKKSFAQFALEVSEGSFAKGEVIGILGPNGTGKTTFIKMLAGVEPSDEGAQPLGIKVAYKPQYLTTDYEGTVRDLSANSGGAFMDMAKRLDVLPLMTKRVADLSGGELQRTAIALCLSSNADAFLLDEPSAFLDIEQRLHIARTLKHFVEEKECTAFVVDHDLAFLDSIADRLIVFQGESGKHGTASAPLSLREGMNLFLKEQNVTYRRDPQTHRPRANKRDSVKDREQKDAGEYYYENE